VFHQYSKRKSQSGGWLLGVLLSAVCSSSKSKETKYIFQQKSAEKNDGRVVFCSKVNILFSAFLPDKHTKLTTD
jgi:hypothetical protein